MMTLFKQSNQNQKGIALLVAMGTMLVVLIIGSLVLYLIVRGMRVTGGQERYETAYEAAVAALEVGKADAAALNINIAAPTIIKNITVGNYNATIRVERAGGQTFAPPGSAIKFARATLGPGGGGASGYYRNFYVHAIAIGPGGEQASLEAIERFTFTP